MYSITECKLLYYWIKTALIQHLIKCDHSFFSNVYSVMKYVVKVKTTQSDPYPGRKTKNNVKLIEILFNCR